MMSAEVLRSRLREIATEHVDHGSPSHLGVVAVLVGVAEIVRVVESLRGDTLPDETMAPRLHKAQAEARAGLNLLRLSKVVLDATLLNFVERQLSIAATIEDELDRAFP